MRRVVLLVTSTLLVGCNAFPDVDFLLHDPTVATSAPGTGQTVPEGGKDDVTDEGPDVVLRSYASRPVPLPKRKPVRVVGIQPDRLVGMTRDEVRDLIGVPATVADKPPATVWSYQSAVCALEVFFYLDVSSQTFRALTYQISNVDGVEIPPNFCLGRIRAVRYGS